MEEPKWLSTELIRAVHDRQISIHGGIVGLRDLALLESALSKPLQKWSYQNPPADLYDLAASYAYGLVKNHAFLDGNKRAAHMAYRLFLQKNGILFECNKEAKYNNMIALASGKMSEQEFAQWLRENSTESK